MSTKSKRDKRVKRPRIYPPVRQQDPDATPEQVARALLAPTRRNNRAR